MEPVLNELSIREANLDADLRASALVDAVRGLIEHGTGRILRSTREAVHRAFDRNLSLKSWLFSKGGSREEKQFLARLLDKAPYVEDMEMVTEEHSAKLLEFRIHGEQARGLGVAHVRDVPAISFLGDRRFEKPEVTIDALEVDDTGEHRDQVAVIHVATRAHVVHHRPWLVARAQRSVGTGSELWARREVLFPRLDFCAHVQKQIESLFGTEPYFQEVIRHLHVLSRTAVDWQQGEFLPPLRWSHESKATLQVGDLRRARTFVCLDAVERVFSPHTKLGYGAKRIAFLSNPVTRRIWIGHVGDHLPTVKFT